MEYVAENYLSIIFEQEKKTIGQKTKGLLKKVTGQSYIEKQKGYLKDTADKQKNVGKAILGGGSGAQEARSGLGKAEKLSKHSKWKIRGARGAQGTAALAAVGGAAYGGKKIYDRIKAKRAEKAEGGSDNKKKKLDATKKELKKAA